VAVALAVSLSFIMGYVVALFAFWATKLDALGEVYFGLGMFLGGRFAPLDALPPPVYWAAWVCPFRWVYAFPVELLMGRITSLQAALTGIVIQLVWLVVCVVGFRLLWTVAVKRYTAVSG
jgi:ABC-2 type transport system permease protein